MRVLRGYVVPLNNEAGQDMNERPQKIIDAKLPLPWLIGCATAIVFSMGGVFVKLDAVGSSLTKLEAKTDNRDERINVLAQSLIQQQGKNDTQDAQIIRAQSDITDIRRDVDDLRKSQRWMPK
jgi:septal ring factor EnvC (AmiA/AmiB activator)